MRLWALAVAVFIVDQLAKAAVVTRLPVGQSYALWPPWLYLTHVRNTGVAFGLLRLYPQWVTLFAAGVLLAAIGFRRQLQKQPLKVQLALGLGLGGAVGNLTDRLLRGAVVDFIDLRVWPVFNLADVAIVLAAGLLIWHTTRCAAPDGRDAGWSDDSAPAGRAGEE